MDWHFAESWTLQYGMRLTQEWKSAKFRREFTRGTGIAFTAVANQEEFSVEASRSEFAFTPKVVLGYDWFDDVRLYATWAKGFKSGGFNEFNVTSQNPFEFETEKVTSWELGTKMDLFDGSAALNVAVFRQDATDLQLLTFLPGSLTAQAVNAGEARSQGVEVDSVWLPTTWFDVVATAAFTDSEFLEFKVGTCLRGRENADGDGDARCDLSGRPLFRAPKWSGSLAPTIRWPLGSVPGAAALPLLSSGGTAFVLGAAVEYKDNHYVHESLEPDTRQPSYFRVNGHLGFANAARGWSARVGVENLTDENVTTLVRDFPLGKDNLHQVPEPQRQVFGEVRWSF